MKKNKYVGCYINLFTGFGFEKIFGTEENKDLPIDFLESLLPEKGKIKMLNFLKTENLGNTSEDRKAVFDLYCENDKGEKYIVELQRARQFYFKDRILSGKVFNEKLLFIYTEVLKFEKKVRKRAQKPLRQMALCTEKSY